MIKLLETRGMESDPEITTEPNEFPRFSLITEVPLLREMKLSLYADWLHLRFEDAKKAHEILGPNVNHYSGKHNYHLNGIPLGRIMPMLYDWFEEQIIEIIEYDKEEQRRDEKRGLYPEKADIAN